MVFLNRIYTGTGDDGTTSLGNGARVAKTNPRIAAYGGVDELNSHLGVVRAQGIPAEFDDWLGSIQNDLFDLGADLCVPQDQPESADDTPDATEAAHASVLRVSRWQAQRLEEWIDACNARLEPLQSFVLPGGSLESAQLHVARTVCRRVETLVVALAHEYQINADVLRYLNRLSDLLFVMARCCNQDGRHDVLWKPGAHRGQGAAADESPDA